MGGIYLDADVEVFKSFDALLANRSFIGFDKMGDIEAAIIGAEKGCQWVKDCLDAYQGRRFKRSDGSLDMQTVPFLIHNMLVKRYGLQLDDSGMVQHHGDLTVFPAEYFSPKNLFEKKVEMGTETVCVHQDRKSTRLNSSH